MHRAQRERGARPLASHDTVKRPAHFGGRPGRQAGRAGSGLGPYPAAHS